MAIDKDLEKKLIAQGKFDLLNELKNQSKQASVLQQLKTTVPETAKKGFTAVAKFVTPVGESIGAAASTFGTKKLQEESVKQYESLANSTIKQLKDPSISKDRKAVLLKSFTQANPDVISQVPELQKTATQVLGEGAITAMSAGFALSSLGGQGLKALGPISKTLLNITKGGSTLGKTTTLASGVKVVPPLEAKIAGSVIRGARSLLSGSLFGTAMALESGKTKPKEIAKDAATMGIINLVAPVIIGRGIQYSTKALGAIALSAKVGVEAATQRLSNYANKTVRKTGNFLVDSAGKRSITFGQKAANFGSEIGELLTKDIRPALTDRLAPIKDFSNKYSTLYPNDSILYRNVDAYTNARNYAGIDGRFTIAKSDFDNLLKKYNGIEDDVLGYVKGLDLLTRLQRGQKVEGGATKALLDEALSGIEKRVLEKHNTQGLQLLRQGVDDYNNFIREKVLFGELVDSGLVKKEVAEQLVRENPNYTPHDVIDFIENQSRNTFTGDGGFNVLDNAVKTAKGSVRELLNVYDATLHKVGQVQRVAERNRVTSQIIEMGKKDPETFGFTRLTDDMKKVDYVKEGLEKVSYFNNGVKEDWLLPRDLAASMRNLDAWQIPTWIRWMTYPQTVLRNYATRFNLAFSLSNFPRDIQTAAGINESGLGRKELARAMNEIGNFNNPQTRAFFEGGGAFGGLVSVERQQAGKQFVTKFSDKVNPLRFIEAVGERFENSTRYAVYLRDIERGIPHAQAIFNARNATVDFAKVGNAMKVANAFIPFLNARTQGMLNIASAIKRDPTQFVRRQFVQSAYPALLLQSWNNQFESYKNVPPHVWENNWVFMVSENDGYDKDGNKIKVPTYIQIKKGEVQQLTSNVIEQYFRMSAQEDPRGVKEFALSQLGSISPVSGLSSLGPLSTPLELTANYDFFRNQPIEPEYQEVVPGGKKFLRDEVPTELRSDRWTGETAKWLSENYGKYFGLSPSRIEFIVGKLFATPGKDLLSIIDMTQTGLDQTKIPENKASTAQILSRTPIIRSLIGTNASGEKIMLYETVGRIRQDGLVPIEIEKELQAQVQWDLLKELNNSNQKDKANELYLELDDDTKNRIKRIKENTEVGRNTTMQVYDKLRSNKEKVLFLITVLNQLETKEEKNQLYTEFKKQNLISNEVEKELKRSKDNPIKIGENTFQLLSPTQ